jgi:AcrR family transcriptional regulator
LPDAPNDQQPTRQPNRWAGVAPADRRAERRTLLLDAAFDLLGTEGWPGTTVRSVCTAARLNPRYFYESFDDLDALVVALYDRLVRDLTAAIVAAVDAAGDDTAAQTRAAVDSIVAFVDDDRRRARVLYVEALGNEALNRRRIETGHALVAAVEQHTIDRHGPPPAGEQIGRIGAAVLVGGTSELVLSWLDGRIDVPRSQLVDDATALFLAVGDAAAAVAARRRPQARGPATPRRGARAPGRT